MPTRLIAKLLLCSLKGLFYLDVLGSPGDVIQVLSEAVRLNYYSFEIDIAVSMIGLYDELPYIENVIRPLQLGSYIKIKVQTVTSQ